jgi:hypothetical protein
MRKKIVAFVFAAAVLVAMAVPVFGSGTAEAFNPQPEPPRGASAQFEYLFPVLDIGNIGPDNLVKDPIGMDARLNPMRLAHAPVVDD